MKAIAVIIVLLVGAYLLFAPDANSTCTLGKPMKGGFEFECAGQNYFNDCVDSKDARCWVL